jgi:putative SOS response-associated peptidase YedK
MATRYALYSPIETLRMAITFEGGLAYPARYNIAPGQPIAILRLRPGLEASGRREMALVRWGLVPHWVKQPDSFGTLLTARAETACEKPSFRVPMRHRRCLIPADGWYVWRGRAGRRTAAFVRPPGGAPLLLAGLWDHWAGAEGSEVETAALLTAHHGDGGHAPICLEGSTAEAWLDVRGTSETVAGGLLAAAARQAAPFVERSIGPAINNPAADGPHLLAPPEA